MWIKAGAEPRSFEGVALHSLASAYVHTLLGPHPESMYRRSLVGAILNEAHRRRALDDFADTVEGLAAAEGLAWSVGNPFALPMPLTLLAY